MNAEVEPPRSDTIDWVRVVDVWRSATPSDEDIRRARRRFALRALRKPRSPIKALFFALAQGFGVGVVTLATAAFVAERTRLALDTASESEVAKEQATRAATSVRATERALEPARPAPSGLPATPAPAARFESDDARTGRTLPRAANAPSGAGTPRSVAPGSAPSAQDSTTSVVALPAPGPDASWKRVAEALDTNDWTRADRALTELVTTGDAYTRDAAGLARAELRLAHGSTVDRATLERLANAGKTPLIRHRASDLLDRLDHGAR
jgi:hypothetical protein